MRGLLVLALFVDVRTVRACTCGGYFAVPDGGAANVPINLKYLVHRQMGPSSGIELVSERGRSVPLGEPEYLWGYTAYRYPLLAELEPQTTYTWGTLAFQTGSARDDDPPPAPAVSPMLVHIPEEDRNTCPPIREVEMELELSPDTALIGVRFIDDDGTHEFHVPSLWTLRGGGCGAYFDLTNERAYDLEVWLYDVAGNEGPRSRTSAHVTTAGLGCSAQTSSSFPMLALLPLLRRRRRASRRPAI